jgi:SAM-dependent methyltransferase
VQARLREENANPGANVAHAFKKAGLEPYVWSEAMARFYEQSDAFLYELVVWNANKLKCRMRWWVARYLADYAQGMCKVLCIGDGLGFDSAYLAQIGHNVTYYEVPGYTESFAGKVFAEQRAGIPITVLTDTGQIPRESYDVVVCLDVLEHVPDPTGFVRTLAGYLRPGGLFIVHAPFYMIHPSNPTHLKANRRYSGSISLYRRHNLRLLDGQTGWNPLVFEKIPGSSPNHPTFRLKILALRLAGLYLSLGRFSVMPFWWVDSYRRKHNRLVRAEPVHPGGAACSRINVRRS